LDVGRNRRSTQAEVGFGATKVALRRESDQARCSKRVGHSRACTPVRSRISPVGAQVILLSHNGKRTAKSLWQRAITDAQTRSSARSVSVKLQSSPRDMIARSCRHEKGACLHGRETKQRLGGLNSKCGTLFLDAGGKCHRRTKLRSCVFCRDAFEVLGGRVNTRWTSG